MAAHAQHLQQNEFVRELPKMDFQDKFVATNVENVSPIVFRKENRSVVLQSDW